MQFLQKHYSNITRFVLFGLLTLITFSSVIAQKPNLPTIPVTCDYPTAPATVALVAGTEPIGFSKTYLLVDLVSGAITARNTSSPTFTGIGQGIYYAVTAYYNAGASIHNDVVGKLISDVYVDGLTGGCLKYSATVGIKVCTATCDYTVTPATIAFTATPSSTPGVTTTYALVDDATNKILQTSSSTSFSSVPAGEYSIVGVYSTGTFSLAVGDTLYAKTTNDVNCVGVSNTIHYKVCPVTCLAGTTSPAITATTVTNTCPTTTFSLAGLANTGTKPAGTSLVWSASKVPTSAGDTLTNLTTVSTAGKYYALYYDKVNNCYSPADSVDATITACNLSPVITSGLTATTPENVSTTTPVYTVTATDPNVGQTQTYSLESGGVDNALFSINPTTGAVTFVASPNFESPTDAGGNNVYDIKVKVCDNGSPVLCAIKDVAITVTDVVECLAGTTSPAITATTVTNTCPTTTFSLAGLANTGTKPTGTSLVWSVSKVPTSAGDTLTNLTTVSTAGKYYALYYDKVNNCYSPADSVVASLTVCTVMPPVQTATINQPKSGTASTDLTPTGGTGPYTYSVDNSGACTPISGATALPPTSNLTVTNASTGAYTYTAPTTPSTYYYCIKVCDSSSPTASCVTRTYTLSVTGNSCLVGSVIPGLK